MLKVVIVLSVLSAVALGAITFTATNKVGTGVTITTAAGNGIKIDYTTAGWAYSDTITTLYSAAAGSNTAEVIYATVKSGSPSTGVGLMVTSTATTTCDATAWTTASAYASLVGKATDACPADVVTVYNTAPTGTSTSTLLPTTAANLVAAGTTMAWTISTNVASTATTNCYVVNVSPPKSTASADTLNPAGACGAGNEAKLKRNLNIVLYAEQTAAGTGSVCLQTQAQYLANPGVCTTAARTAVGVTFTSPIKSTAAAPTATTAANGITVSFTAAGWITSDPLALYAGTAATAVTEKVYTTVASGTTTAVGVGVVALPAGGAVSGCTTSALAGKATLLGLSAATDCPSDFLTVYNVNPSGTSTSALIPSTATNLVAAGKSVAWTLTGNTAAAVGNCNQATVIPPKAATDTAFNNAGTCDGNNAGIFKRDKQYGIYIESLAAGSVSVCVQNQAQYSANAGVCTSATPASSGSGSGSGSGTSSASIVSAIMAPIVLVMLMIFA